MDVIRVQNTTYTIYVYYNYKQVVLWIHSHVTKVVTLTVIFSLWSLA